MGLFGWKSAGRKEREQQELLLRQQQDWEEYMSNTAHQREYRDLQETGINPIMTATGGSGASTPSVSAPSVPSQKSGFIEGVDKVANFASMFANTAQGIENISTQEAQQELFKAQAIEALSKSKLTDRQRDYVSKLFDVDLMNAVTNQKNAETNAKNAETNKDRVNVERDAITANNASNIGRTVLGVLGAALLAMPQTRAIFGLGVSNSANAVMGQNLKGIIQTISKTGLR